MEEYVTALYLWRKARQERELKEQNRIRRRRRFWVRPIFRRRIDLSAGQTDSLAARQTITNLEGIAGPSTDPGSPLLSPNLSETPTTSRGTKGEASSSRGRHGQLSVQNEAFLGAIKELRPNEKREETPIEQFCSRLADGLSKLPREVSNRLQVEFLSKLVEEENLYLE